MLRESTVVVLAVLSLLVNDGYADGFEPPFGCNPPAINVGDAFRKEYLKKHNDIRVKVAKGNEETKNGYLPSARNMYKLMWNCTLETLAVSLVASCTDPPPQINANNAFNHKFYNKNEAGMLGADKPLAKEWTNWEGEVQMEQWLANNVYDDKFKNYANIIKSESTGVGCAESICGNPTGADKLAAAACVYEHPKLAAGDTVYESGQPCSGTGKCTTYTPSGCDKGLCVKEVATTPASTIATTAGPTTNAHPRPELNQICPTNPNMEDSIRTRALEMHNYRRSQLANGRVKKHNGNALPQASNMIRLRYDCQLELRAKAESDTCSGNDGQDRNAHVVSTTTATTRVMAIEQAVKNWWRQVRLVPGIGVQQVTFRQHHTTSSIRTFTRIAWATTELLGCGVTLCGSNYVVVCQYSPPGNVIDTIVYQKGTTCSNCPTGFFCESSLCNKIIPSR